jgi:hypothetical protein
MSEFDLGGLDKPKIDLKKQPTVVCEECENNTFREVVLIKKVPKLMTGSSIQIL